jgi:hypothetical protein
MDHLLVADLNESAAVADATRPSHGLDVENPTATFPFCFPAACRSGFSIRVFAGSLLMLGSHPGHPATFNNPLWVEEGSLSGLAAPA